MYHIDPLKSPQNSKETPIFCQPVNPYINNYVSYFMAGREFVYLTPQEKVIKSIKQKNSPNKLVNFGS